jgi:CheY-like chemotaxis protein
VVELETVSLNNLAGELEPLIQRAVGDAILVELALEPQLDLVRLDQRQFQAAILNLAGNARDAMPSGGRLRIETRRVQLDARDVAGMADAAPGTYALVIVSDTGTGMDAATAAKAFEPFFTTKEVGKGTGLGLSQVYGFARQAGGFCRVRTTPGQGCAIEMYLPRAAGAVVAPAETVVIPLRRASGGEVVLVVEDEDAVREMAAESLDGLGYGVITAPDARVALEILRGPSRIDILFSDVVMPGGMNGAQLAVEARAIRPDLRVLLTSGYIATATGGVRDLPEGVPLLRKPYLRADLAAKLQAMTGS